MMATEATAKQRVVVIAIDASDNAKDAFDCTYIHVYAIFTGGGVFKGHVSADNFCIQIQCNIVVFCGEN